MTAYPFDTEKPPTRVVTVRARAGSGAVPEVRALFAGNPGAAEPFRDWLASGEAWEAFGAWYDSAGFREHEERAAVLAEANACECVFSCADDPETACSLSGEFHVHPEWPCPVHPDAPGDR